MMLYGYKTCITNYYNYSSFVSSGFLTSTFLKFMYNENDDLNYCSNNRTIL